MLDIQDLVDFTVALVLDKPLSATCARLDGCNDISVHIKDGTGASKGEFTVNCGEVLIGTPRELLDMVRKRVTVATAENQVRG